MFRHYLDPTEPFVNSVSGPAHGAVITSATLRDALTFRSPPTTKSWKRWPTGDVAEEARTGHAPSPGTGRVRAAMASPFDYAASTCRVLIVRDVRRDDADQIAAAYRELFVAAGGGALGLFTAIGRLRAVHQRIAPAIEAAGLPLYAQHVGGMDAATLVDIFRAEEHSCLLGTDAVRDGVDVPGRSLRLIVFDRVPGRAPTSSIAPARRPGRLAPATTPTTTCWRRLRARQQAYGRLIRRATDRGVCVHTRSAPAPAACSAPFARASRSPASAGDAVAQVRAFVGEDT